jgi:hypothetical protein
MCKQLLTLGFFVFISNMAIAQVQFGAGATLINDFGVQGRAKIGINEKINALPALSYFFSDGTVIAIDAVGSYDITEVEDFPIYATGGLTFLRFSGFGSSFTTTALNLGGGTIINSRIYAELRLLLALNNGSGTDLGLNVGYYF